MIFIQPTAHYQPVTTVEQESLHSFMSQTDSASPINTIIIKIILYTYLPICKLTGACIRTCQNESKFGLKVHRLV